jgi:hypothetical protein
MEVSIEGVLVQIGTSEDRSELRRRLIEVNVDPNPYTQQDQDIDDDVMFDYCLVTDAIQAIVADGRERFGIDVRENSDNPLYDGHRMRIYALLDRLHYRLRLCIDQRNLGVINRPVIREATRQYNRLLIRGEWTLGDLNRLNNFIARVILRRRY